MSQAPVLCVRPYEKIRANAILNSACMFFLTASVVLALSQPVCAELLAGAAKIDITNEDAGPVSGRLHARALVLKSGDTAAVIVTLDVVAIGEIGKISNEFLATVRERVEKEIGIKPSNVIINASHCHGIPCADVAKRTVIAISNAVKKLEPVDIGVGHGHEDRIQENRRLVLKSGRVIDVRHAYSMPRDEAVVDVGPIDPDIGILRLNRKDGRPLAVLYNFACHPIQGVPSGVNTADMTGFSSEVIEDNLGEGTVALFVQGCGGDINPAFYKSVSMPRDAETLGNTLALSTLKAVRKTECTADSNLKVLNEVIELPRADLAERITEMAAEQEQLVRSLRGTTLSLKTFLPLIVNHGLSNDFPTYYSHSYLNEDKLGRVNLRKLDADNRNAMLAYLQNINTMERLTRLQTNLRLLEKHQQHYVAAGKRTIDVEVVGLRIGNLRMITFPGELTVQIGLNLKKASPHKDTFILGYTNGYIYYCPTAEQRKNVGYAQEDSDCLLAPEWQQIFETKAKQMLENL